MKNIPKFQLKLLLKQKLTLIEIGKIFKSFLRGKIVPIGSFKSNSHPKFKGKKKLIYFIFQHLGKYERKMSN